MPELPEVEILTGLLQPLAGQRISGLRIRDPKIRLPPTLSGQVIERIYRRAKFIIFDLQGGGHLLVHLRMTGWFKFSEPARYRLAILTPRATVYFEDSRRFGVIDYLRPSQLPARLAGLGPEPLDQTGIEGRLTVFTLPRLAFGVIAGESRVGEHGSKQMVVRGVMACAGKLRPTRHGHGPERGLAAGRRVGWRADLDQ